MSGLQPSYVSHSNWTVEADFEFLDPARSNALLRAFYVPGVSRRFTKYNRYSTVHSTVQYNTVQYNRYLLLRRVTPRRLVPAED